MTIRLYEQDAYLAVFEAVVLSCEPAKKGYAVVLDQTAFFPEGGGQPADIGTLGDAVVCDVQIKNDIITHVTDKPLAVGETVSGTINWDVRYARMQNHTAEHLLSGLIHREYGYDNVGFHLNDDYVTLDVSGSLSAEDVARLESEANRAVYENHAVTARFPTPEELPTLDYRSKLDLSEGVRLVTIEGCDVCACCAPHVAKTGEIGIIKILDFIPYKGGTRITMLSGAPAYRDYAALHEATRSIMRLLSAPRDKVAEFVSRDHETIAVLRAENVRLAEQLVMARLETVVLDTVVCGFTKDASFDALRACTERIAQKDTLCAVFSFGDDGSAAYILSQEDGDVRDTVKALNAAFNGKGGGKPVYAQGKLTATKEELLAFFRS